ncbi:MAG: phosphotransferase [Colwellia sp.]|nr:phosphotransferase [Colwellia sp.]
MSALVNGKSNNIVEKVKALPCFVNNPCEVEPLTGGESHACFKVTVSKKVSEKSYFVKSLAGHQETAKAEVSVNLLAAEAGLAPEIIYHSSLWLVCEFIHGKSLAKFTAEKTPVPANDKIMIAMNLMVKIHQLQHPHNCPVLVIQELLLSLAADIKTNHLQQVFLNETIKKITPHQSTLNHLVLCHGDVNYENIRLSDSFNKDCLLEKNWLVDYECSCLAEAEYDIAMFIAINALGTEEIDVVIQHYQQYANLDINKEKVRAYLTCCYLINGLWYFKLAIDNEKNQTIRQKSRQQFVFFDQLVFFTDKAVDLF